MKAYLMKVICAALVCALAESIGADGPGKSTRRLIGGLFLVLAVLSPLGNMDLPRLDLDTLRREAEAVTAEGTALAEHERFMVISDACESYIWNKAAEMGLELQVLVVLDDDGLPLRTELSGPASPLERQKLTQIIVRELGLGKEDVIWTESHQSSA